MVRLTGGAPLGNQNASKGGRTVLISVRVTPALNAAMDSIAREKAEQIIKTKSDLIHYALSRVIREEYPDIAAQFPDL